jgi:hypothetical protein
MFILPASSVSALAGRHQYTNRLDEVAHIIARYNPVLRKKLETARATEEQIYTPQLNTMRALVAQSSCQPIDNSAVVPGTTEQALATLQLKYPNVIVPPTDPSTLVVITPLVSVKDAVTKAISATPHLHVPSILLADTVTTPEALTSAVSYNAAVTEVIHASLGTNAPPEAVAYAQSAWARTRGIALEGNTLRFVSESGFPRAVKDNNLWQNTFGVGDYTFKMIGRVDGIVFPADNQGLPEAVIEIKNRTNRFFVPNYDVDQLAAYCVLTNAATGILVQQLDGAHRSNTFTAQQMATRWDQIVLELKLTLDLVRECYQNPGGPQAAEIARKLVL